MSPTAIFWPMIAHVALVMAVYALLGLRRAAAVRAGSTTVGQFRENRDEPLESLFVRNNLENQFELPVLFHIGCLALFETGAATTTALVLAWLFVLSRCLHTIVHVGSNRIRYRQPLFSAGFILVAILWGLLALHLATA